MCVTLVKARLAGPRVPGNRPMMSGCRGRVETDDR